MPETPPFHTEHSDLAVHSAEELLRAIEVLQGRVNELEQSLERQERLATLGTIAGLIAHEFNNILTPVMSYAQMAIGSPDDRELSVKAHQKAAEGADRAGQIASAILGLVRRDHAPAAAGGSQRCRVAEAIERAQACLARGGTLLVRSTQNLPSISTSAVVSWSGGGRVGDAGREWPIGVCERENVVIEVSDTGRGMSAERMSRLFELSGSTQRSGVSASTAGAYDSVGIPISGDRRGHGLGMLVCKRLVEDAGGVMAVESEPGRGTRVWVVWPAAVGG